MGELFFELLLLLLKIKSNIKMAHEQVGEPVHLYFYGVIQWHLAGWPSYDNLCLLENGIIQNFLIELLRDSIVEEFMN